MLKRRDILMLGGGSIVALPLTPIPYKLLDDTAIWTQNWPWIPVPKAGAASVKNSVCTLCRAGCAIAVRMVDDRPIGVMPRGEAPGGICALAFGSHQLPWHKARLRTCLLDGKPADCAGVAAAVANAAAGGKTVAVLDERPGRAMSGLYRRFASAMEKGIYATPVIQETATLEAAGQLCGGKSKLRYDWSKAATVLSVGAPLLDGWPGAAELIARRAKGEVKLIHAGSNYSRQAQLSERFIPLAPGSECAFALGLAGALMAQGAPKADGLREFESIVSRFPLERASAMTALKPETFKELAQILAGNSPAVVVGGGDFASGPFEAETEELLAALNVLLGSVGREGGIIARPEWPGEAESKRWNEIPDGSVDVLIADRAAAGFALPWNVIERKLAKGAFVAAISTWNEGLATRAQAVVAAPAPMEDWTESAQADQAGWAVAPAVLKRQEGAVTPDEFLTALAAAMSLQLGDGFGIEDEMKSLAAKIHASKKGEASGQKVSAMATADDLWKAISEGAAWSDQAAPAQSLKPRLPGAKPEEMERLLAVANSHPPKSKPEGFPLALLATGWVAAGAGAKPPLARKVEDESLLRRPAGRAAMNPSTAQGLGLKNGDAVKVETRRGEQQMTLTLDDAVLPNAIESEVVGGGAMELFEAGPDGTWRQAWARVRRA
ncbi:MAG: hypothetical protein IH602_08615 [Bryobacteraceae bacterium]|nr:hypothetical protein [Bryobacteraceae bacterium]